MQIILQTCFWFYPMDPRILGHNHPKGPPKNQPPNHHSTAVPEAAGTTMGIDVYNSCLGDPSGTVDGFGGLPEHFPVSQPGWFAEGITFGDGFTFVDGERCSNLPSRVKNHGIWYLYVS